MSGRTDGELIDFGVDIGGSPQRLYLRRGIVERAGLILGMVPKHTHDSLQKEIEALEEQVKEYGKSLEQLQAIIGQSND